MEISRREGVGPNRKETGNRVRAGRVWELVETTLWEWLESNAFRLGAGLAYYTAH
jgi:uncharacterized BrkB/YihY/UPF0761 family membrane protein